MWAVYSANLRTSGNTEQFTIEENPELHEFYERTFSPILERFKTNHQTASRKEQWHIMNKQMFNL